MNLTWLSLLFAGPAGLLELWRRIKIEFTVELPMLMKRWKILLFGLIMQYVHGIFTQLAHRMHQPQPEPLHDIGFALFPELGPDKFWISEVIFSSLFVTFVLWTFTPFLTARKRFYTVVMWSRLLMVLVVCQALRIISFTSTQLPGPGYHCRSGQESALREWPDHWTGHVTMDVAKQATKSCGDLIFSSHTTFMLTGIMAYNEFGTLRFMKLIAWCGGAIVSCLIIASRKHYTVDIVIAWYTVPLVFYTMCRRWSTVRHVSSEFFGAIGETSEPMILDEGRDDDVESGAGGSGGGAGGGVASVTAMLSHAEGSGSVVGGSGGGSVGSKMRASMSKQVLEMSTLSPQHARRDSAGGASPFVPGGSRDAGGSRDGNSAAGSFYKAIMGGREGALATGMAETKEHGSGGGARSGPDHSSRD